MRSLLESAEVEHRWEAGKLVVDAPQRTEVQELLDEVVAASRPRLEADADRVAYELADWPAEELRELEAALDREGILGEWTEDGELLVYESDEERVDALFEELGLHGPDDRIELEGEELTGLLNDVYLATDRLARDARDPDAVVDTVTGAREVAGVAPPLGFDERAWEQLVGPAGRARRRARARGRRGGRRGGEQPGPGDPRPAAAVAVALLAELELFHSRPIAPTRRLALGRQRPADRPLARARAACCSAASPPATVRASTVTSRTTRSSC